MPETTARGRIVNASLRGSARKIIMGRTAKAASVRTPPEARPENGVVRFENVGLRYGLGPEVLRDLTFRIEPHSFQFLTGPSGAGKTSLLRLLFLSLKPTRGLITLFGHDVATLTKDALATLRRRIGIVFQDFRLLDHMTTYENVALPFRVLGQARGELPRRGDRAAALGRPRRAHVGAAAGAVGRREAARRDRARGDRAAAAAARRRADRQRRSGTLAQRLLRLFVELNKSGTSVVIATHDIALMDQYDARRLVLHEGRLHDYD